MIARLIALFLVVGGLFALVSAGADQSGAGEGATSRSSRVELIKFRPTRVRPHRIVFGVAGIPPTSVRAAHLRYGHRRRALSVKYVRNALASRHAVQVRRVSNARRARLVIAYRVPDYFVSPNGSDSNPGTEALPFLTLNRAYVAAAPGDSVAVEGGTYPDPAPIAFDPVKSSPAVVTFEANGDVHLSVTDPTAPFVISGDHVRFRGRFEFDRIYLRDDAHGGADDVTFRGTHIHSLILCGQSDYAAFYNNRFGPNNLWGFTPNQNTGAGDDTFASFYCGEGGFHPDQANTNIRIVGNHFNGAFRTWTTSHSDCIQVTLGSNVLIARNKFRNCNDETIIVAGDQGHLSDITIENNYLGRPLQETNPYPVQISGSEACIRCIVRFNSSPIDASLAFLNSGSPANPNTGSAVYGNITLNDPSQCAVSIANGWVWDSNLFVGAEGTCGTNAATIGNPYRNSSSLDLRLIKGSPAINRYFGSQAVPATDIDGTRRPQGRRGRLGGYRWRGLKDRPELGAYEVP